MSRARPAGPLERRAWLVSAVLGIAVALVAGVAVVAHGFERSKQDLSAATVWVTRTASGQLGRANTSLPALDTAVKLDGDGAGVAQDASTVVLHSSAQNALTVMDPAAAKPEGSVNLPAGSPQVVGSGSWIGVLDPAEGQVWVRRLADVTGFDPGQDPDGSAGAAAVLGVDQAGRWVAYSRASGRVSVGGDGHATTVAKVGFSDRAEHAQVALVDGDPVVFDPDTGELYAHGSVHRLGPALGVASAARLMASATDTKDITLASPTALVSVPAGRGDVEVQVDSVSGSPAAPVHVDGCWYAAWAGGSAGGAGADGSGGDGTDGTGAQWCDGRDPETFPLSGASAAPTLRVNGDSVLANDTSSGRSWALQDGGKVIDNWADFSKDERTVTRTREDLDTPPTPVRTQRPPEPKDDEFGARPGRANVLPVLLNDSDPNGDPLLITSVSRIPVTVGKLSIVENGQKVQLTTRSDATGTVRFKYTVDDGHRHHATANVSVRIVGADENHAPYQARTTRTTVVRGGRASLRVLDDWVDPESDPIYLSSVAADAPDSAISSPEGTLDFTHGGGEPGVDTVRVSVSDGSMVGDGKVSVTVKAQGQAPIIAENTTLTGVVGNQLTVVPTDLARGGDARLSLTQAKVTDGDARDLKASVSYADGTVRLQPRAAGEYEVTYSVTDGHASASGVVRVVITAPPSAAGEPVVSPTTAFLYLRNTTDVDVLAHASDPGGGVLSVTKVGEAPAGAGVLTEIVDSKRVRVTLKRSLAKPLTLDVTVSNGQASSVGRLTLVQIPEPAKLQAPVARDDTATVRAGEVVELPVLDNDEQPDGRPLQLQRRLLSTPKSGLLVTAGDRLRYLAPSTPGTYTGRYAVSGPDGRTASATVTITVTALDAAENRPPSAPDVTARARAGQAVKIPVPVTGTDPDGDATAVSAITSQPEHGTVIDVQSDSITYVPNAQTVGTDSFSYRMVDGLGAASVGTVRVGVEPSGGTTAPPVAEDDLVTTRPGTQLSVDVTQNDTDPAGGGLRVTGVESRPEGVKVAVHGGSLQLRVPEKPGSVGIMYRVQDTTGAASYAWLTVDVRKDAPLAAPVTQDATLSLSEIDGRASVPVDVLAHTTFSEGDRSDLSVSLPEGFSEATVDGSSRVVVPVGASRQVIPFTVSRKDAPQVGSTSFLTVPGTAEAPPERRADAPGIEVTSGHTVRIPLHEQVIAAQDRSVAITDPSTVQATNGSAEAPESGVLTFTAPSDFWGRASVSATVTDGRSSATILLPITVRPQQDPAPVLHSASVSVEADSSLDFDLRAATDYVGSDPDSLRWSASGADASLVDTRVTGSTLRITAAHGATPGRRTQLRVSVSDAAGHRSDATLDIAVVASRKPPPSTQDDTATLRRGASTDVDVLGNDFSPLGERALKLTAVDTQTGVKGVSATVRGSRVHVSAGSYAATGTATFVYTVQDSTGDASRQAQGVLRVSVQDVPDAPAGAPAVTEDAEHAAVTLSVQAPDPNASPITTYEYRVNGDDARTGRCGADAASCRVTGLPYGKDLSFQVRAVNAIGAGDWSASSRTVMMDHAPSAPRGVGAAPSGADRSGHTLNLSWSAPAPSDYGSAVRGYDVLLTGPGLPSGGIQRSTESTKLRLRDDRVRAGEQYSVAVTAHNARLDSAAATTTVRAVGAPTISQARAGLTGDGATAQVSWNADGRGGTPRARVLPRSTADGDTCSVDGFRPNTDTDSWSTSLRPGADTRYVVDVSNGLFCTRAATTQIDTTVGPPSGRTSTKEDRDGATQGVTPSYRLSAGSPAAAYTFVLLGSDHAPAQDASGWTQAKLDTDTEFGRNGEDVTVWAMSCRTSDRLFCSTVARIGTEKAVSVDLGTTVDAPQKCSADGSTQVTVTPKQDGTDVSYQFRDADGKVVDAPVLQPWQDLPADGRIMIPAHPAGERISLYLRATAQGFTYDPNTAVLTCNGTDAQAAPEGASTGEGAAAGDTTPSGSD